MKDLSFRLGDIELRSCDASLTTYEPPCTCEIVKWESKDHAYTLAYWVKDSEGFDLMFVGARPFDVDQFIFMHLARIGQYWLDIEFRNLEAES